MRGPTNAPASPATSTTRSPRDSRRSDCTSRPVWRNLAPADRAQPALRRALDAARQGLEEARRSITSLRRSPLENRSLGEALAALSREFTADTGVRVRVEIGDVGPLPAEVESELFRIAGEALTNVRKHAGAREAALRLDTTRDRVRLTVADAGVGFRLRRGARRGFGLSGIEDRARLVGGRAAIRSAPGRGTTVTVTVPKAPLVERYRAHMISVLIVEDHPIVREGVTAVLEREPDIDVVGAADTIADGLRLAATLHPDVILLDLKLPDAGAADGVASFARENRSIVVFTAYDADDDVFRAIQGGARGYLLKGSPAAEIGARDPAGSCRRVVPQPADRREAGERHEPATPPRRPAERP